MTENMTVTQLVSELGAPIGAIFRIARLHHIFVRTRDSVLIPEHARVIRGEWLRQQADRRRWSERRSAPGRAPTTPWQQAVQRAQHPPAGGGWSAELAPIAAFLGAPSPRRPRRPRSDSPRVEPINVAARELMRREHGLDVLSANKITSLWVTNLMLPGERVIEWWNVMGGRDNLVMAVELRRRGITPDMLAASVNGRPVVERVRDGMAPEHIERMLRQAGLLHDQRPVNLQ